MPTLHPSVGPPQLLGEGGSSFAWLIHYTNYQMCAKCPKPNINKREISVFRCRLDTRIRTVSPAAATRPHKEGSLLWLEYFAMISTS